MDNPFHSEIANALGTNLEPTVLVHEVGDEQLASWFHVSDFAIASISAAATEAAAALGATKLTINRRYALKWFDMTLRPIDWELPSPWDAIAGDYQAADGWIRLHTNAVHHREAALRVLECTGDREVVANTVRRWKKADLEKQIVDANGCAAAMHSLEEWSRHPQGRAVANEPLIAWKETGTCDAPVKLDGLRVLDLTRVLAGPVATRFLAGYGANVLRIDPPGWSEPAVEPEVTLGKRCAGLDLTKPEDRAAFETLISTADVLVHGYRLGALEAMGYGPKALSKLSPNLIDVSLNAYGHTGPWTGRRGFDSLVQMSCGIAYEAMVHSGSDRPVPLPVQALDHATGYLMAAAVLRALRIRQSSGKIMSARLSLARTAHLLTVAGTHQHNSNVAEETNTELAHEIEATGWGPAKRIAFPVYIEGHAAKWPHASGPLRQAEPAW